MTVTVLDGIVAAVERARTDYHDDVKVAPIAVVWTDDARQWQPVVDRLVEHLPIITLGDHDPSTRTGPAYWVRCVVARTIPVGLPDGSVPVVYLPGVARRGLRAVDDCPAHLAPLAELQYRSQWFTHPGGNDWTIRALLAHAGAGLGLPVADDAATRQALSIALPLLLDETVDDLARRGLDAASLHALINPDLVDRILQWIGDPAAFQEQASGPTWDAFVAQCRAEYGLDPGSDGAVTAASRLGARSGPWGQVWARYVATPVHYTGVDDQLAKARPAQLVTEHPDAWPQDNDQAEDQLRALLADFTVLTPEGARKEVVRAEAEHGARRATVWADLGRAPLAFALEHLASLAEATTTPLTGATIDDLRRSYETDGWQADDALLRALAATTAGPDRQAVSQAAGALYRAWLDAAAKALQGAVDPSAAGYRPGPSASTDVGTVTVFVDGLRLDLAHRVADRLAGAGLAVATHTSLAALPTVTDTAKPALVPMAEGALSVGPDLAAGRSISGARATKPVLWGLAQDNGVACLEPDDTGDPTGTAWTEAGRIDHLGHEPGVPLVDEVDREVEKLVVRIRALLGAGWARVDVVTDHGFLLLPGELPKVDLPVAVVEKRKGRCARLKPGANQPFPTVPWHWDPDVRIAIAPGAACFEAGKTYEHGGVSPQECFVPRLTVESGTGTTGAPEIVGVKWLGLLCRIEVAADVAGITVDLRGAAADPSTSIAETGKTTSGTGRVSLVVPDEDLAGEPVHLVLVAADGQILAQRPVVVGSNR